MSPDYWRFSALLALQTAAAGYPSLLGHTIEHRNRQLPHHAFSPRGLLQTLQRVADINNRSYLLRKAIEIESQGMTDSLVFNPKAIWGIAAKEVNRKPLQDMKPLEVHMLLSARTHADRPICLPDIQLIEQLAGLELDHDLDDNAFLKTDYPKVAEVIGGLMDPSQVFVTPSYRRRFGLFPEPTQLHLRPYELPEILSQKDGGPRKLKVIEKIHFN